MTMEMLGENRIAPGLLVHEVDVNSVSPHPENMRQGNVPAIAQSLARYGQVKPIVVQRSTGYIVAGNHTYFAAQSLGWPTIAAVVVNMDDRTALAYLIADNKTSDLGSYHRARLVGTLQRLADAGWLEETMWTADELDDLFQETEAAITSPEEFNGTFALTEDQLKEFRERAASSKEQTGARRFREVPLLLNEEDHRTFIANVTRLELAYETKGKVATIIEAVRREAAMLPVNDVSPIRSKD